MKYFDKLREKLIIYLINIFLGVVNTIFVQVV